MGDVFQESGLYNWRIWYHRIKPFTNSFWFLFKKAYITWFDMVSFKYVCMEDIRLN